MALEPVYENPRLRQVDISGNQMRRFIHNNLQRGLMALPGRPVMYLHNSVRLEQVTSMRDSYVNAFLIQSRGFPTPRPCSACRTMMRLDRDGYARPFPYCIRMPGHFGGCCGNCKWPDHAASCTNRDAVAGIDADPNQIEDHPGSQVEPIEIKEEGTYDDPIILGPGDEGTQENPIELD